MDAIETQSKEQTRALWLETIGSVTPVVFGYLPVGFAYGILAQKAGLSLFNTLAMSIFVYAGSSQLIAVGLMAAGAAPASVILTTFVVNLRHLLMSAALSPYLRRWRRAALVLFGFELTDETFALHSLAFPQREPRPAPTIAINAIAQLAWIGGTWLGAAAGGLIADVRPYGLDYALVAMFAALLIYQLKSRLHLLVAIAAGLGSTALLAGGVRQWNVLLAAVLAATLGLALEQWTKKRSS